MKPLMIGWCSQKVCPFKNFGKAEMVKRVDGGGDGLTRTDDKNFDGSALACLDAVRIAPRRTVQRQGQLDI